MEKRCSSPLHWQVCNGKEQHSSHSISSTRRPTDPRDSNLENSVIAIGHLVLSSLLIIEPGSRHLHLSNTQVLILTGYCSAQWHRFGSRSRVLSSYRKLGNIYLVLFLSWSLQVWLLHPLSLPWSHLHDCWCDSMYACRPLSSNRSPKAPLKA